MSINWAEIKENMDKRELESRERGSLELLNFIELARKGGITSVAVEFAGSGDDGSIDSVVFEPADNTAKDQVIMQIERTDTAWDPEAKKWNRIPGLKDFTLSDAIEEIVYNLLDGTGVDWCNNDGGYGTFILDVVRGTYNLEVNQNYTESNNIVYLEGVNPATGKW